MNLNKMEIKFSFSLGVTPLFFEVEKEGDTQTELTWNQLGLFEFLLPRLLFSPRHADQGLGRLWAEFSG